MTQNESNIFSLQVDAKKAAEVAAMLLSKDLKTMDVKQFLAFTVPKIENWSKQLERLKEYSQKRDFCNASDIWALAGPRQTHGRTLATSPTKGIRLMSRAPSGFGKICTGFSDFPEKSAAVVYRAEIKNEFCWYWLR